MGIDAARFRRDVQQFRLSINKAQHFAPVAEALQREIIGQAQLRQPEIWTIRVLIDEEWIVGLAEKAGVLSRRDGAVADGVGIGHERRHASPRRGETIDDGAVGGKKVVGIAQPLIVGRRSIAAQAVIAGRVVIFHGVVQGAHQRHLVHDARQAGEAFAHRHARHIAGDGLELAADGVGRGRFHVEGVVMTGTAPLMQEDNGASAGLVLAAVFGGAE
jgi:hypothetical protein